MKSNFFVLALTIGVVLACSPKPHQYVDETIKVNNDNVPLDSTQYYFPEDLFHEVNVIRTGDYKYEYTSEKLPEVDTYLLETYSSRLYAMKEPLLFNKQLDKEVYRFLWDRSFHYPFMVRIEKSSEGIYLYWKLTNGQEGSMPGKLSISEKKKLKKENWNRFVSLLDSTDFWQKYREKEYPLGDRYLFEGVEPSRYHATLRSSPGDSDYFLRACVYLASLTERPEWIDRQNALHYIDSVLHTGPKSSNK